MVDIPVSDLKLLGSGRTTPYLFDGRVFKFDVLPAWSFFADAQEKREILGTKYFDIEKEFVGTSLAKTFGIFTPDVFLERVSLVDGNRYFLTRAATRKYIDGRTFDGSKSLLEALSFPCHRFDLIYILLVDILIGNWNRGGRNLIYDSDKDVLIPIDYEAFGSWEKVPMTTDGIAIVFEDFLFLPDLSGIRTTPFAHMRAVARYISNNVNYIRDIDDSIKKTLIERRDKMDSAIVDFVKFLTQRVNPAGGETCRT